MNIICSQIKGGFKRKGRFKKIVVLSLISTLALTGCVSSSVHDEALKQIEALTAEKENLLEKCIVHENEVKELSNTKTELMGQISTLEKEIDDFKNGAANMLVEIKNYQEAGEYAKAIEVAQMLHEKFNDSSEDLEGQDIAKECQGVLDKIEAEKKAEQAKIEAEKQKSVQDRVRDIIRVTKIATSKPNSAGGVDLFIGYKNMSDKVIKYATFSITPYNKVGDKATCDIRDYSQFNAQDEGPHKKGAGLVGDYNWYWENAWYCWTISTLELNQIYIEYMDGSTVTLTGDELKYVKY